MAALFGRRAVLARLDEHVRAGHVVLMYGPRGVGMTTTLRALATRCRTRGLAVGLAPRSVTLGDLVAALQQAYPDVAADPDGRRTRARLQMAAERQPCVLLLDHVGHIGTAFKSLLRSLRGTGSGVVIAGDADGPREHEALRALRLTHREIELPRLGTTSMYALLRARLARASTPCPVRPDDVRRLVRAANGLPGRAAWFASALANGNAWRDGRVRVDWLQTEMLARTAAEILDESAERFRA